MDPRSVRAGSAPPPALLWLLRVLIGLFVATYVTACDATPGPEPLGFDAAVADSALTDAVDTATELDADAADVADQLDTTTVPDAKPDAKLPDVTASDTKADTGDVAGDAVDAADSGDAAVLDADTGPSAEFVTDDPLTHGWVPMTPGITYEEPLPVNPIDPKDTEKCAPPTPPDPPPVPIEIFGQCPCAAGADCPQCGGYNPATAQPWKNPQPCVQWTCSAKGTCVYVPKPVGTECYTVSSQCWGKCTKSGECSAGCGFAECSGALGFKAVTEVCKPQDLCSISKKWAWTNLYGVGDVHQSYSETITAPTNDSNVCTADSCVACQGVQHLPVAGPCQVGDACGSCVTGACEATPTAALVDVEFSGVQFDDVTRTTDGSILVQGKGTGPGWATQPAYFVARLTADGVPLWQVHRAVPFWVLETPLASGDLVICPAEASPQAPKPLSRVALADGAVTPLPLQVTNCHALAVLPDDSVVHGSGRYALDGTQLGGWPSSGGGKIPEDTWVRAGGAHLVFAYELAYALPPSNTPNVFVWTAAGKTVNWFPSGLAAGLGPLHVSGAGSTQAGAWVWGAQSVSPSEVKGGLNAGRLPFAVFYDGVTGAATYPKLQVLAEVKSNPSGCVLPSGGLALQSRGELLWTDAGGKVVGVARIPGPYVGLRTFAVWPDGSLGLRGSGRITRIPFKWQGCGP